MSGVYTRVQGKSCVWLQGPEHGWLINPDAAVFPVLQDSISSHRMSVRFPEGSEHIAISEYAIDKLFYGSDVVDAIASQEGSVYPLSYDKVCLGDISSESSCPYILTSWNHYGHTIGYWTPYEHAQGTGSYKDIHMPSFDLLVIVVPDIPPRQQDSRIEAIAATQPKQVLVVGTGQENGISWCRFLMLSGIRSPKYLRTGQCIVHDTYC